MRESRPHHSLRYSPWAVFRFGVYLCLALSCACEPPLALNLRPPGHSFDRFSFSLSLSPSLLSFCPLSITDITAQTRNTCAGGLARDPLAAPNRFRKRGARMSAVLTP